MKILTNLFRRIRDYYRARVPARLGLIGVPAASFMGPIHAWLLTRLAGAAVLALGLSLAVKKHNDKIRAEVHELRDKREAKALADFKKKTDANEEALRGRIKALVDAADKKADTVEAFMTVPGFVTRYPDVWPKALIQRTTRK